MFDIGGIPTTIGIKVTRSYTWCLKSYTGGAHKNTGFKCQPSIPRATFCIKRYTPFVEIDDKGEEIETKILQLGFWTWTMDKEGATLRN